MEILYNAKTDLLYIRIDDQKQDVINKRLVEDVVLDMGEGDRIVGIVESHKVVPVKVSQSRTGQGGA